MKVALTRQQIFNVTTHRSDTIQRVRLGTDESGRILAIGHDVYSGNLRSEQQYEAAADQTRTLYAGASRLTRHRLVPLDAPVASSMRAPGEAVGLLALECAMDELGLSAGNRPHRSQASQRAGGRPREAHPLFQPACCGVLPRRRRALRVERAQPSPRSGA